jgi:hypothetical protein
VHGSEAGMKLQPPNDRIVGVASVCIGIAWHSSPLSERQHQRGCLSEGSVMRALWACIAEGGFLGF